MVNFVGLLIVRSKCWCDNAARPCLLSVGKPAQLHNNQSARCAIMLGIWFFSQHMFWNNICGLGTKVQDETWHMHCHAFSSIEVLKGFWVYICNANGKTCNRLIMWYGVPEEISGLWHRTLPHRTVWHHLHVRWNASCSGYDNIWLACYFKERMWNIAQFCGKN